MWIETITVRTARPEQCDVLLEELSGLIRQKEISGFERVVCYRNLEVENEISIHFFWNKEGSRGKTAYGQFIAGRFARFGLIHHTLWEPSPCAGREER